MTDTLTAMMFLGVYPIFGALLMGLLLQSQNGGSYFGHTWKVFYDLRLVWAYSYIAVGFLAVHAAAGQAGVLLFYVTGLFVTAAYELTWRQRSQWYQKQIEPDANARLAMVWLPFFWPAVLPIMLVDKRIPSGVVTAT